MGTVGKPVPIRHSLTPHSISPHPTTSVAPARAQSLAQPAADQSLGKQKKETQSIPTAINGCTIATCNRMHTSITRPFMHQANGAQPQKYRIIPKHFQFHLARSKKKKHSQYHHRHQRLQLIMQKPWRLEPMQADDGTPLPLLQFILKLQSN